MSLWAIVPVKPFAYGKSRLAGVLPEAERLSLNERMLARTLQSLAALPEIEGSIVVSKDSRVLDLAIRMDAEALLENGLSDLNRALNWAREDAVVRGATRVLVIPADLPGVHPGAIGKVITACGDGGSVVIAPDRHRQGTNALLVSPAHLISFEFGGESFSRHCESAGRAGGRLVVVEDWALALDLDWPEDLSIAGITLDSAESSMIS